MRILRALYVYPAIVAAIFAATGRTEGRSGFYCFYIERKQRTGMFPPDRLPVSINSFSLISALKISFFLCYSSNISLPFFAFSFKRAICSFSICCMLFSGVGKSSGIVPPIFSIAVLTSLPTL